jgi:hypothetical protein
MRRGADAAISNPAPFHALTKITSFLAKYRKTALVTRFRKRRDESAR